MLKMKNIHLKKRVRKHILKIKTFKSKKLIQSDYEIGDFASIYKMF